MCDNAQLSYLTGPIAQVYIEEKIVLLVPVA